MSKCVLWAALILLLLVLMWTLYGAARGRAALGQEQTEKAGQGKGGEVGGGDGGNEPPPEAPSGWAAFVGKWAGPCSVLGAVLSLVALLCSAKALVVAGGAALECRVVYLIDALAQHAQDANALREMLSREEKDAASSAASSLFDKIAGSCAEVRGEKRADQAATLMTSARECTRDISNGLTHGEPNYGDLTRDAVSCGCSLGEARGEITTIRRRKLWRR